MELYHVTRRENLPSIRVQGLQPSVPEDMPYEVPGVYLFVDWVAMEDAVMNWLGDRFDGEEDLVLLTLSPEGVTTHPTVAGYEVVSYEPIPPENILRVDDL